MRLLADHCVPEAVVRSLHDAGHETIRVVDVADPRASDTEVAGLALSLQAVLITADSDFARRRAFPRARYGGIVLMRDLDSCQERVVRRLLRVLQDTDASSWRGRFVVIDRRSARNRR